MIVEKEINHIKGDNMNTTVSVSSNVNPVNVAAPGAGSLSDLPETKNRGIGAKIGRVAAKAFESFGKWFYNNVGTPLYNTPSYIRSWTIWTYFSRNKTTDQTNDANQTATEQKPNIFKRIYNAFKRTKVETAPVTPTSETATVVSSEDEVRSRQDSFGPQNPIVDGTAVNTTNSNAPVNSAPVVTPEVTVVKPAEEDQAQVNCAQPSRRARIIKGFQCTIFTLVVMGLIGYVVRNRITG
jgi:hypothetical protein